MRRVKKNGRCPSVDGVYSIKMGRKVVFYRRDGKCWYTTNGDPRKTLVSWSLTTRPEMIGEWEWIEADKGMPRESKRDLMEKAPLFGVGPKEAPR
jgi:hypothetical protein